MKFHPDIMNQSAHYATVSIALRELEKQGYVTDFNLESNKLLIREGEKLKIVDVYRYEGDTDPADEATVYALESENGMKGFFVTGYGIYTDKLSEQFLKKIH